MSKHLVQESLAEVLRLVHLLIALARLVLVQFPASAVALVAGRVGHGMPVGLRGPNDLWRCKVGWGRRILGSTAD